MSEMKWEIVEEVSGELQGQIIRGLLEAQDIPVFVNQEGAGRAYGINIGPLGVVQILVPVGYATLARRILDDFYSGQFDVDEDDLHRGH